MAKLLDRLSEADLHFPILFVLMGAALALGYLSGLAQARSGSEIVHWQVKDVEPYKHTDGNYPPEAAYTFAVGKVVEDGEPKLLLLDKDGRILARCIE